MTAELRTALTRAVESADMTFVRELHDGGAIPARLSIADRFRIGRALGRDVYVVGDWPSGALCREISLHVLTPNDGLPSASPVTWVATRAGQSLTPLPAGHFHYVGGDLFFALTCESAVGDITAGETLRRACMVGVPLHVQEYWHKELSDVLTARRNSPMAATDAAKHVAAKLMTQHSAAIKIELPPGIADTLGLRVAKAFHDGVKLQEEGQGLDDEWIAEKQETSFDYLISAMIARAAGSQPIGDRAVQRLAARTDALDVAISAMFRVQSDSYAFRFDDGSTGWALAMLPGDCVRFPYVGLPLPRVATSTGLLVAAHVSADGTFTMARASFAEKAASLISATSDSTVATRLFAMLRLMWTRQSSLQQQRQDASAEKPE